MSAHTRSQRLAQAAFPCIQNRHSELTEKQFKDYVSFAKKFPALIHTCGLAQAVAFAVAKKETKYVDDLAEVLKGGGHMTLINRDTLAKQSREIALGGYLRLSRDALNAADWLKRYAEAFGEE